MLSGRRFQAINGIFGNVLKRPIPDNDSSVVSIADLRPLEPIPPRIGIEPGTLPLTLPISFEVSLWNRIEVPAGIRALLKSGEIRFPKKCVAESTLVSWRSFLRDDSPLTGPNLQSRARQCRLCRPASFGSG